MKSLKSCYAEIDQHTGSVLIKDSINGTKLNTGVITSDLTKMLESELISWLKDYIPEGYRLDIWDWRDKKATKGMDNHGCYIKEGK